MSNIQLSQPGGAGTLTSDGNIAPGIRCYLSAIGVTAASWTLTGVPSGSSAVTKLHPRLGWYFDPDVVGPGNYDVRLTDTLANNYTNSFSSASLGSSGPVFNVCEFGAVPIATAEYAARNTAAIYGAASVANARGGGRIYFPTGSYAVVLQNSTNTKNPLYMKSFSNVEFFGDGKYASKLVDPQAMSTTSDLAAAGRGSAFITFEDCTNCGVRDLGFQGANVWSQARISSGTAVLNRKGVYFRSISGGCPGGYVLDCYFTGVEGETVFADGAADGLRVFDNHFYRCQVHAINWNAGSGLAAYRNRIEDCAQSAFQGSGNNVAYGCNVATMSNDPSTGNAWITSADAVVIANMSGGLFHDNIFYNYKLTSATASVVAFGYNDVNAVDGVAFVRNIFERCLISIGAGNHNGILQISAAVGPIKNAYIADNVFIDCGGLTSGGAYRAAIKASGGQAIGGAIGPNLIHNGTSGTLDVGVHFDSALNAANTLRLETQRCPIGAVGVAPYVMDVAAGDDARTLVGAKTWDPGNVVDGAMTSTTVIVAGCRTGDAGVVSFTGATLVAGLIFSAISTSTDTMTVTLFNKSGGPVDLGSGTLTVHVSRT